VFGDAAGDLGAAGAGGVQAVGSRESLRKEAPGGEVKCLRNGVVIVKRLSGCAHQPELVVSGRPAAAGEENRASTVHPEGGRVYTPIDREAKTEIPVKTTVVYTHVLNRGGLGVHSPLDQSAEAAAGGERGS